MRDLRVGAVCMRSETGKISKNIEKTSFYVSKASKAGADVICFPELSITGYTLLEPSRVWEDLDQDAVMESILRMARENNVVILAGLVERSDKAGPWISHIVAGPRGLLGIYRKTHLSPPESGRYEAGQDLTVFSSDLAVFGIQLCYETHFPELSTVMALRGVEVLFLPHASPRGRPAEKLESWQRHIPGRAFDNGFFVIACNQAGTNKEGLSFPAVAMALGPDGRVLETYKGKGEGLMLVDLKSSVLDEVRNHRMRYFLPHRRPQLYREVSSSASHRARFTDHE
ncbi:MAG: nitrilase-related carbon-nitrogen hydrolase [Desulfatiglandales bacterium]